MKIYDTRTENFIELKKSKNNKEIKIFVCGPTVYDETHLGHARTYISFDIIVRWLRYKGFKVFYLQNITDVDDKIIERAKLKKISPLKLSLEFEKKYHQAEKILNITSVSKYAKASKFIKQIIKQVEILKNNGNAYETKNGIYFSVESFPKYGELSKQLINKLKHGIRIENDKYKKNPLDFALWKKNNSKKYNPNKTYQEINGEPAWKSPWGIGRPGWHIEDTAITDYYFGPQYDIHGGASELKFPHHEAEIAQEESISKKHPMVKIWMHTGILLVNKQKMSKSLNNFITVKEFTKKYHPDVFRIFILNHSYRSPINFNINDISSYSKSLSNLHLFMKKLLFVQQNKKTAENKKNIAIININKFEKDFSNAMDNDFNTTKAIALIFSITKQIENKIWHLSKKDAKKIYNTISKYLDILGFINTRPSINIPKRINKLLDKRAIYREKKEFLLADNLRNKINELGYNVEDTPFGQFTYKIEK